MNSPLPARSSRAGSKRLPQPPPRVGGMRDERALAELVTPRRAKPAPGRGVLDGLDGHHHHQPQLSASMGSPRSAPRAAPRTPSLEHTAREVELREQSIRGELRKLEEQRTVALKNEITVLKEEHEMLINHIMSLEGDSGTGGAGTAAHGAAAALLARHGHMLPGGALGADEQKMTATLRAHRENQTDELRKQIESLQAALEDKRTLITTLRSQLTGTRAELLHESSLREQAESALASHVANGTAATASPATPSVHLVGRTLAPAGSMAHFVDAEGHITAVSLQTSTSVSEIAAASTAPAPRAMLASPALLGVGDEKFRQLESLLGQARTDRAQTVEKLKAAVDTVQDLQNENEALKQSEEDLIEVLRANSSVALNSALERLRADYAVSNAFVLRDDEMAATAGNHEKWARVLDTAQTDWERVLVEAKYLQEKFAISDAHRRSALEDLKQRALHTGASKQELQSLFRILNAIAPSESAVVRGLCEAADDIVILEAELEIGRQTRKDLEDKVAALGRLLQQKQTTAHGGVPESALSLLTKRVGQLTLMNHQLQAAVRQQQHRALLMPDTTRH